MRILYFILLICLGNAAKFRTRPTRIAGGHKIKKGQFPYFAQLWINSESGNTSCGASLIHPQWVLSAASCFYKFEKILKRLVSQDSIKVYMGTNKRYGKWSSKNFIKKVIMHPWFVQRTEEEGRTIELKNNIALGFLKRRYRIYKNVGTIALPQPIKNYKNWITKCSSGIVIGIGKIKTARKYSKYVMFAEESPISLDRTCFEMPDIENLIVTSKAWLHGHTMKGDFGGPFVCYFGRKAYLYGVMSYNFEEVPWDNKTFHYGFYERVDRYLGFISNHLRDCKVCKKKKVAW